MAKAGLLFVGTDDGLVLFSDPGTSGRWLRIGHELRGQQVLAIWPLFENPQIVLAGGEAGLWRSTDGGASWSQSDTKPIMVFAGSKAAPQQVWLYRTDGTAEQSDDGGATWATADDAPPATSAQAITLAGNEPVWLAIQGGALVRSSDNGANWQPTLITEWQVEATALAAARYHMDTAYAGNAAGQLAVTTNRGQTWQIIKRDLPKIRSIVVTRLA